MVVSNGLGQPKISIIRTPKLDLKKSTCLVIFHWKGCFYFLDSFVCPKVRKEEKLKPYDGL